MADFYKLLEIPPSADSTQIRAAYKRLAFHYHPDLNPGNPKAEEMFKAINEAYHTLSDPLKKSRYDSRLNSYQTFSDYSDNYWRDFQRQQYARWKQAQRPRYRFDREYFRIQGLAFLTFLIISGFCFGVIQTVNYFYELQRAEITRQNIKLVMQVNSLFDSGKIDEAFSMINKLQHQDPLEFRFITTHDSLLNTIRMRANTEFDENHLSESLEFLRYLKKYESPARFETLRKIAVCEYNTGRYDSALQALKQLHKLQPWNFQIVYQIGLINLVNLDNPGEALRYLTLGKKMFKENLTRIYGDAFEIVMDPSETPDLYYELFEARAKANIELQNFSEAIKDCNWAIFLRPAKAEAYKMRAISKIGSNELTYLCTDLNLAQRYGATGLRNLRNKYCR